MTSHDRSWSLKRTTHYKFDWYWIKQMLLVTFIKLSDICYFPNPPKAISEIPCTNWRLNTLEEEWAAIEERVWSTKDASSNYYHIPTLNSGLP